ncbi:MAG: DMT family transporter [Burkholderiales bacterium]|nr:MAG: DMT family transporter [Burkholderiales bacterium]
MNVPHAPLRAVLLLVGACLSFALLDSVAKYLSQTHHPLMVAWARYVFHVLVMAAVFLPRMGRSLLRTRRLSLQLARGVCLGMSSVCFFSSIAYLPLAEATAIVSIVPILVTVGAVALMHERAPRGTWWSLAVSFAGVLLIVRPGGALFGWPALLPLLAALFIVGYQLLTRKLSGVDNGLATLFIGGLVAAVLLTAVAPSQWQMPQGWGQALLFVSTGVIGAFGHLLLVRAYEHGSAAALAPFSYTHPAAAVVFGLVVFGQFPDALSLAGIVLIVATGVLMAVRGRIPAQPIED